MLLPRPELKAFFISAIRHRKYKDAIFVSKKQFFEAFRNWRWSHGFAFRKHPGTIYNKSALYTAYSSQQNWSGNVQSVISNCRKYYQIIPPKTHPSVKTFRASGGKRLAWPGTPVEFMDVQDFHSWHRLYWVLDSDIDSTIKHLQIWLDGETDEIFLHPYTTSERICNLCQFIAVSALPDKFQADLINQIYKDANWLYDHFEDHLGIHNHLLNNARALCAAAYAFKDEQISECWLEKARFIWDKYWPKLILEDGFFSEQSTYYHVLLTRTLLEYLADVKLSGRPLPEAFLGKAKKMVAITNLLIRSDGTIPIFGDASPDMPVEWLRGLSKVCKSVCVLEEPARDTVTGYAGGASRLTKTINIFDRKKTANLNSNGNWIYKHFKDSGFLFVRNDRADIEIAAMGYPGKELHGHCDTGRGSYEIWWKGRQIVVDGGIPAYGLSPEAVLYKSVEGQNCVAIDGIAPTLLGYQADELPEWYTKLNKPGKWEVSDIQATYTWHGFERYKTGLVWRRTWSWNEYTVTVSDRIFGAKGKINLSAYLHLGEKNWKMENKGNKGNITGDWCAVFTNATRPVQVDLADMPHSPNYGVIKDSLGIKINGHIKLPLELEWKYEFFNQETNIKCAE